jgi:uncharacterized protein (DUF362 family)
MAMDRRSFLRAGAGASVGLLSGARFADAAQPWVVGVGRHLNAYEATRRAVEACGEWPLLDLAGSTVVVKPNLVAGLTASSGTTTDPEVVRAIVDLALARGASEVQIVETSPQGAHFGPCGYGFFGSYDPRGRVRLVDLKTLPLVLAPNPDGLAYQAIYLPELVRRNDIVFISVGKLKVHCDTGASLSTKNLFGLPGVDSYLSPSDPTGRFAMHDRGVSQAIVDVHRLRPVHFAVVDAMWAMEGVGPVLGAPVRMDTVIAGRNCIAVDRVALAMTELWPGLVRHLVYASRVGLGPSRIEDVIVRGDPLETRPFALWVLTPTLEYPHAFPAVFNPRLGERTTAITWYLERCVRTIDVLRLYDDSSAVDHIKTIADSDYEGPGYEVFTWDGRDQDGLAVPPGRYALHIRAASARTQIRPADAMCWLTIL